MLLQVVFYCYYSIRFVVVVVVVVVVVIAPRHCTSKYRYEPVQCSHRQTKERRNFPLAPAILTFFGGKMSFEFRILNQPDLHLGFVIRLK